jgi:hypothetical protein
MSRALKISGALAVVLLAVVSFQVLQTVRSSSPSREPAGSRAPHASGGPTEPEAQADAFMYRDFAIEADARPTEREDQSKLWFANGSWWGVLLAPGTSEYRIHRLDWDSQEWIDTGVLVDERPDAHADVLAEGEAVWIVSAGDGTSSRHAARLVRFTFNAQANRYDLDADFPVQLTDGGARGMTLARDSLDRLWVAYVTDAAVVLNHTSGDDHVWGAPFALPLRGSAVGSDQAVIVAHEQRLTIVWSNQRENALYVGMHEDSAADDDWTSIGTAMQGVDAVDDHIDVKVLPDDAGGRLFIAAKTSLDIAPNPNPEWEQIVLLELGSDGTWNRYLYGTLRDRHTRPILQLDPARGQIYLIAASPVSGGAIYYKQSPLDHISFPSGKGRLLVAGSADTHLNSPTSSKQAISDESGLVVLAFDGETKRYLHGVLPIAREAPDAVPDAMLDPQPAASAPPTVAAVGPLLSQSFDPWPSGVPLPNGWNDSDLPIGVLVADPAGGQIGTINAGPDGSRTRACRPLPTVAFQQLTVELSVAVSGFGDSDTELLSLSGGGTEAVSLRVNSRGRLAYLGADAKTVLDQTMTPGTWYRLSATIDAELGVYAWSLSDASGALVAAFEGLPLIAPIAAPDRLCLETASGIAGEQLAFDNLTITRSPRP